nr:unnamed protein product [Callosobruchus analis]
MKSYEIKRQPQELCNVDVDVWKLYSAYSVNSSMSIFAIENLFKKKKAIDSGAHTAWIKTAKEQNCQALYMFRQTGYTKIAKYSALLEPVVNALQSIALDVVKASQHVKCILQLLKSHRDSPERVTDEIIKDATVVAEKVGLDEDITSMPHIVGKQRHRNNHPAESLSEF